MGMSPNRPTRINSATFGLKAEGRWLEERDRGGYATEMRPVLCGRFDRRSSVGIVRMGQAFEAGGEFA